MIICSDMRPPSPENYFLLTRSWIQSSILPEARLASPHRDLIKPLEEDILLIRQIERESETMVQYVFTPWRDRYELLLVREQMYTGITTDAQDPKQKLPLGGLGGNEGIQIHQDIDNKETRARQHQAVARVSMWMQRGNCPHLIESTALLMAAMLSDREAATRENAASSAYAIRAAYSAAFSR
jgi:hypothetical protein